MRRASLKEARVFTAGRFFLLVGGAFPKAFVSLVQVKQREYLETLFKVIWIYGTIYILSTIYY